MKSIKTIYLVDDDEDDLFLLQEAISELKLDVRVNTSLNGKDLLGLLNKDVKYALVLMDVNMPVMNGIETLRTIQQDPDLNHIRSIIMSTYNSEDLKKQALGYGAIQFVAKPPLYSGYLKLIEEIFSKSLA